jgi:hypothetical protein
MIFGKDKGSMAKLWTLAVLCVGYGAWIVLALPREAVVNAIPFVFWALLFAWLAARPEQTNPKGSPP